MAAGTHRLAVAGFAALAIVAAGLPAATATATATGPAATATVARPATPPGGPVPAGFRVADLSFVGTRQGWALGTAPCSHKPCTSVLRTSDGGASWVGIPAPIAYLRDCTHTCVSGLRFANPQVGYAFRSALELTTNGGQTWHKQPGNAIGLGISKGMVIRVSANHPSGCPPGCTFRIERSTVGSTTWHTPAAPRVMGDGADVEAAGASLVVTISQNPAGGAPDAHVTMLLSRNSGRTWRRRGDPCGSRVAGEDDTVSVAMTTRGRVAVLCRPRRSDRGTTSCSRPPTAGRPSGPPHAVTAAGGRHGAYLVATTGRALFVATDQFRGSHETYSVDASRHGGRGWTRVLRTSGPARSAEVGGFLGFETDRVGHFVGDNRTVSRTSDAGRSWATHRFPG